MTAKLTRDIRCQKCRKLLAKTPIDGKLIVMNGIRYYQGINCIEIQCRNPRCKEKNYIALEENLTS